MAQCMQLFTNTNLLIKLSSTFQKYLKEYANRILNSSLPKYFFVLVIKINKLSHKYFQFRLSSTTSFSSIGGAASSLMQNFQIQTILKEAQNVANSDSKKLTESEICKTCSILCTSEYCLETIQQVYLSRYY